MKGSLPMLEKERTALLIIDMQNDFCKPGGFFQSRLGKDVTSVLQIVPTLSDFLNRMRRMNIFRIFVRSIFFDYTDSPIWLSRYGGKKPEFCLPNSWGSEIIDELKLLDNEPVVTKHRYSAFIDTPLELILRSKGIRNLLLTGTATNVCVESTARDAFMKDYLTVTVEDCVSAHDSDLHQPSLKNLSKNFGYVATSKDILKALK